MLYDLQFTLFSILQTNLSLPTSFGSKINWQIRQISLHFCMPFICLKGLDCPGGGNFASNILLYSLVSYMLIMVLQDKLLWGVAQGRSLRASVFPGDGSGEGFKKMLKGFLAAVLLSASVERCFVSRMRDFSPLV